MHDEKFMREVDAVKRLHEIEVELEMLGGAGALDLETLPERFVAGGLAVDDPRIDLEAWSSTVVAAVTKAVWASPLQQDADERFRRSSRARELRALATPIEFEAPPPPPRKRPEPETAKPPSWAWAANHLRSVDRYKRSRR